MVVVVVVVVTVIVVALGYAMTSFFWRRKGRSLRKEPSVIAQRNRVAVIGGGIAGCSAAWALKRSGIDVVLFEKEASLGGNAKTHFWPTTGVRTGLSVLAWPRRYFHHYAALLSALGEIETQEVQLPFCVEVDQSYVSLSHTSTPTVHDRFQKDLLAWMRMVGVVRRVNAFFHGDSRESVYKMSLWNPFNLIPLRLLSWVFGVSSEFWNCVVVPIYSSTFLSTNLNFLPAVIVPVIDAIIPLERCPSLVTWTRDSTLVFARLTEGVTTHLKCELVSVSHRAGKSTVTLASGQQEHFDRVIFACSSDAALGLLKRGHADSLLLSLLLSNVSYVDDDWGSDFLSGVIHSESASVLRSPVAAQCAETHSNYVAVDEQGKVSNTFILSSWVPAAQAARRSNHAKLVTYGKDAERVKAGTPVNFHRSHPHLCLRNLIIAHVMRWVQGRNGMFFCASWTTPGNGHDLSLCSGLLAAYKVGAAYPFGSNPECVADMDLVQDLLGQ